MQANAQRVGTLDLVEPDVIQRGQEGDGEGRDDDDGSEGTEDALGVRLTDK